MKRLEYEIIPPEQVQPGDVWKFIPAGDGRPKFADVLQVLAEQDLIEIEYREGGGRAWTPIHPHKGEVIFGRPITRGVQNGDCNQEQAGGPGGHR